MAIHNFWIEVEVDGGKGRSPKMAASRRVYQQRNGRITDALRGPKAP